MNKTHKILISAFISTQLTDLSASIVSHKGKMTTLQEFMSHAHAAIEEQIKIKEQAKEAFPQWIKKLEFLSKRLPIKITERPHAEFRHYHDSFITYSSPNGRGIIHEDSKFYQAKTNPNDFNYTTATFSFHKRGSDIRIYTERFSYQESTTQRLIHLSPQGEKIYTYTHSHKRKGPKYETLSSAHGQYTIKEDHLDRSFRTERYRIQTKEIRITPDFTEYTPTTGLSYRMHRNGALSLNKGFQEALFEKRQESRSLLEDLRGGFLHDFLSHIFRETHGPLTNAKVLEILFERFRKKHKLEILTPNKRLQKVSHTHALYLSKHNPRNPHLQQAHKQGYTGKTAFQRRKHFKYPYKVTEWISWGTDIMHSFHTLTHSTPWQDILLSPKTRHFAYSEAQGIQPQHIILFGHRH